ncbi:hypothetical protein NE237_015841 [Protea cynaroides]|uniref:HIG1 domain-containing protein n=1 Tax=Protea cynaroides TaxID=273540 RepID=A0A9Q0KET7_9MAGN|nr:hypothetical protein NE237_015841 [Protea cynaroides]
MKFALRIISPHNASQGLLSKHLNNLRWVQEIEEEAYDKILYYVRKLDNLSHYLHYCHKGGRFCRFGKLIWISETGNKFVPYFHGWRPFQSRTLHKTLEPDICTSKPSSTSTIPKGVVHSKRPCLSDRTTGFLIDNLDVSKLSLLEDDGTPRASHKRDSFCWIERKRRRYEFRSVSGRSSDKSGTRRCCSIGVSAAYATCSDFPVAASTDSSGEMFVNNGDANWASDVSEANKHSRRDGTERDIGSGERDNLGSGSWKAGVFDSQCNESGYGSEPGYRGDAEFGYGDELDGEEEDGQLLFWGHRFGDIDRNTEMLVENTFSKQKAQHSINQLFAAAVLDHRLSDIICNDTMADNKSKVDSIREWIVENKLRAVGSLWLSGIVGSIAYNWSQPNMKTSVRIIHARLHAQGLTLAALAGAAIVEYYDHKKSGAKAERYAKFLQMEPLQHKD